MKIFALHLFTLLFAVHAGSLCAQTREQEAAGFTSAGFTLTISENHHEVSPPYHEVLVRLTNTSEGIIRGGGCLALRGMYNISIVYDGVPIEETDAVRKLKKYRKEDGGCTSGNPTWRLKPGEYHDDLLSVTEFYNMSKPGAYEITVTKETFPDHPERSVTVKSNTITIVVPEPGEAAPQ